ncbi:MAG: relaxase [Prevotella sp.]|nr:relaxase [Prevotella sp.]MBQ6768265.1 relaxase [Prevotella sp.]MBR0049545.1 relaxase [Prevotella sp.]MBR0243243.1 relaxase [Bacteroidaceae bacterium]
MIGKAKAISYGINDLRYIMGESRNKKHPEKINFICCRHLPQGLDAMGVWESMQASLEGHVKLKNSLIRIELSPARENTAHFTFRDWEGLWRDFMEEFDRQTIRDKNGKVRSKRTNLAGSKGVIFLHEESKGEVPHLHGAFCRVDEDGNINNDHDIHLRAQHAAEAVARRRGWKTAMDVRTGNAEHISSVCEAVLKAMPEWSWADYVRRVESADGGRLQVKARKTRWGPVKGYSIIQDGISYKASELGSGRNLTYPKLAETWRKLHSTAAQRPGERPATQQSAVNSKETIPSPLEPNDKKQPQAWKPMQQPATTNALSSQEAQTRPGIDYTAMSPGCSLIDIDVDGTEHRLYLPQHVLDFFDGEFDDAEILNWEPLANLACAYFAALLAPDAPSSGGGGSSASDSGWGRKKDEDDMEFARRCAEQAMMEIGVQVKKKSRGIHR